MNELTNDDVRAALTAAGTASLGLPERAFAACIVDTGGHLLGLLRDTKAAISAGHSAETKARTAMYLHIDTGAVPPTSPIIPALTAGVPYPLNMFPGGLLIRRDGHIIGAIGAAGSPDPAEDLLVANAALGAIRVRR